MNATLAQIVLLFAWLAFSKSDLSSLSSSLPEQTLVAADLSNAMLPMPNGAAQATEAARANALAAPKAANPRRDEGAPRSSFEDELNRSSVAPAAKDSRGEDALAPARRAAVKSASDNKAAPVEAGKPAAAEKPALNESKAAANERGDVEPKAPVAPKRSALESVHKAAQGNRQEIDANPTVALLTGHLEKLEPARVPALVATSGFVNAALAEDDTADFMNKPAAVSDLVKDLGLSPKLTEDAERLGLSAEQKLAPAPFLKALGVDAQQVGTELSLLKSNLLLEGLSPYINRATALNGGDGNAKLAGAAAVGALGASVATDGSGVTPNSQILNVVPSSQQLVDANALAQVNPNALNQNLAALNLNPSALNLNPSALNTNPNALTLNSNASGMAAGSQRSSPFAYSSGADQGGPAAPTKVSTLPGAALAVPNSALLGQQLGLPLPMSPALDGGLVSSQRGLGLPNSVAPNLEAEPPLSLFSLQTLLMSSEDGASDPALSPRDGTLKLDAMALRQTETQLGAGEPVAPRASFDAFALMGDQLRAVDTNRINFAAKPRDGQDALAPMALSEGLQSLRLAQDAEPPVDNVVDRTFQKPLIGRPGQSLAQTPKDLTPRAVLQVDPNTGVASLVTAAKPDAGGVANPQTLATGSGLSPQNARPSLEPALLRSLLAETAAAGKPALATPRPSQAVNAQDLRLLAPTLAVQGASGREDAPMQQDSDGRGERQLGGDKLPKQLLFNHTAATPNQGGKESTFAAHTATPDVGLTPQQRVDLVQKVLNHATLLMREGGGSMRLDLGSPELGSLQMAINVNKDQLDMRVLTGSDRVRDAMMADLSQLKNALSVQNVRLGNVEVGVSGRQNNPFAGFEGAMQQNGQNQGRGFDGGQQDSERRAPPVSGISGLSRPNLARMQPAVIAGAMMGSGGRIAVRA